MKWLLWAFVLILQNAAFTWVSRARNSGSVRYHAVASVCSNGVWMLSNMILISEALTAGRSGVWSAAWLIVFYATFTTIGATLMHFVSMRYLETGKRRVGAA